MKTIIDTFMKYFEMGGYVMPPLILATLALWFGIGFRISLLKKGRSAGSPLAVIRRAARGDLGRPSNVVERAALLGVYERRRGLKNLKPRLEATLGVAQRDLGRFRVLTGTVTAVAPLLGLLGTVSGMIETFASLGDMRLYSQSGGIASGISQALLTTQFGLAIAIPGLIFHGLLNRRQRVLETEIDEIKDILATSAPEVAQS